MLEDAATYGNMDVFDCTDDPQYSFAAGQINKSRNRELRSLFSKGFGMHNAGMLRSDRNLVERYFEKGLIKVLCCTGTFYLLTRVSHSCLGS
jgi:replicative superfamily II helicase